MMLVPAPTCKRKLLIQKKRKEKIIILKCGAEGGVGRQWVGVERKLERESRPWRNHVGNNDDMIDPVCVAAASGPSISSAERGEGDWSDRAWWWWCWTNYNPHKTMQRKKEEEETAADELMMCRRLFIRHALRQTDFLRHKRQPPPPPPPPLFTSSSIETNEKKKKKKNKSWRVRLRWPKHIILPFLLERREA